MLIYTINVFVSIEDISVRSSVLELFKNFTWIDNLKVVKSLKEISKFSLKQSISFLVIDPDFINRYEEKMAELRADYNSSFQFILVLTGSGDSETYKRTNNFDYIIENGELGQIKKIFNEFEVNEYANIKSDQNLGLSERELKILNLICCQYNSEEIGIKLHLGKRTIENHRFRLLWKTGAKNTAGLVIFAVKNGVFKIQ